MDNIFIHFLVDENENTVWNLTSIRYNFKKSPNPLFQGWQRLSEKMMMLLMMMMTMVVIQDQGNQGAGGPNPLPTPTHTHLPHYLLAGTKAKAKPSPSNDLRLMLVPLDYYLPPWISRPFYGPDDDVGGRSSLSRQLTLLLKVPIWIECVILTQDFHHKDRGGNGHLHILWTAKTSVTSRTHSDLKLRIPFRNCMPKIARNFQSFCPFKISKVRS